ncbi:MAG: glycosyltransferase family 2 protein [Frankiaceae bacterium]
MTEPGQGGTGPLARIRTGEQARSGPARVSVVIATRDRRDGVLTTVGRLRALPERPPVIVVDNASSDGTADAARAAHADATVLRLPRNLGAVARNVGVARATTPYVAFADDDSWWQPGALATAVAHFDSCPRLALLAARVLVGDDLRIDATSALMRSSPLPRPPDLPGPAVLGFLACGAIVRRDAFLGAGGFSSLLHFLGEEAMLAYDLAAAGWALAYADDVVAEHHPSTVVRESAARRRLHARNDLLTTWLRRPLPVAIAATGRLARRGARDAAARGALADVLRGAPDVAARRSVVPSWLESQLRTLRPDG